MENKNLTAVEWLSLRYHHRQGYLSQEDINQAKEMEKQQMKIELPSDEEIDEYMTSVWFADNMQRECFKDGAKWMRSKIQNK